MHFRKNFTLCISEKILTTSLPAPSARTGPYGEGHTVIREDLPCSPCYAKKRCNDPVCLTNITIERVLEAVREKLK